MENYTNVLKLWYLWSV